MSENPRLMVLDGGYRHSLTIVSELKRELGGTIASVASSPAAHAFRSRYTDVRMLAPRPTDDAFVEAILQYVENFEPHAIVPVGHASFSRVIQAAHKFPASVNLLAPSVDGFEVASDKVRTYDLARSLGIRVPLEYSRQSITSGSVPFPIFAKARKEQGGPSTALLRSKAEFEGFDASTLGGDVMFQEYIAGDAFTLAHNGYFQEGVNVLSYQHIELRSVPRQGGSGTRVRTIKNAEIATLADRLMSTMAWSGVAQVEFKRAESGEPVLMEINPKFWASYSLGSRNGFPLASAAVADLIGRDIRVPRSRRRESSMVFPMRELAYAAKHRQHESMIASAASMLWPPAQWDVEFFDVRAHLPQRQRTAT